MPPKPVTAQQRQTRREEAEIRQAEYNKLTPSQKLARLDAGGFVARRQRARIISYINSLQVVKETKMVVNYQTGESLALVEPKKKYMKGAKDDKSKS